VEAAQVGAAAVENVSENTLKMPDRLLYRNPAANE